MTRGRIGIAQVVLIAAAGVTAITVARTLMADAGAQQSPAAPKTNSVPTQTSNVWTMEVAQAVMVTVELDFGDSPPNIAEALRQVERRYTPEDGQGRTFAILDAYGEPTADGQLHISMHVGSEKAGMGSLVFRRTGEVLWTGKIVPATQAPSSAFAGKSLNIMIDDGAGKPQIIDGSKSPRTILDAVVRDYGMPVRDFWPEGEAREVTFIYSTCGCPVKVMAKRAGDRTVRTKDLPVIFPDDPGVSLTLSQLMGW